jgi:hypothetical protein
MSKKTRQKRVSQRMFAGLMHFTRRTGVLLPRDAHFVWGWEARLPTPKGNTTDYIALYFAFAGKLYASIALHITGEAWSVQTMEQTAEQATKGGTDFMQLAGPETYGWLVHAVKTAKLKGLITEPTPEVTDGSTD